MFLRFLFVGGSGFLIDAGGTYLLIALGIAPWLARIPAIAVAMIFTWVANRHFTYKVTTARSANEAIRYMVVAAVMALLNYLIYLALIEAGIAPVAAVTIATACQTLISFYSYRHFVFRKA